MVIETQTGGKRKKVRGRLGSFWWPSNSGGIRLEKFKVFVSRFVIMKERDLVEKKRLNLKP